MSIENGFPLGAEGFDEDVLDGLVVPVAGIEFAAALRPAEMGPVGSAVASTLEPWSFEERFQENAVALVAGGS